MLFQNLQAAGALPLVVLGIVIVLWVILDGDGKRKHPKDKPYPQFYNQEEDESCR